MKDGMPLYIKLRNELVRRIEKGKYNLDTLLPSERSLIDEFEVSRETVRRAVIELERLGYIHKKQGVGAFVVRKYPMDPIEPMASFTIELEARGVKPGDKLISKKILNHPPKIVIETLKTEKVLYTRRIRFADEQPFAIEDSYFPIDLFDCLNKYNFKGSYYQLIVHKCKIPVTQTNQGIYSRISTKEEMKLLSLKKETPILGINRTWFSYNKPIYYLIFSARADLYSFKSEVRV